MIIYEEHLIVGVRMTSAERGRLAKRGADRIDRGIYTRNGLAQWNSLKRWDRHRFYAIALAMAKPHMALTGLTAAMVLGLPVEGCPKRVEMRGQCSYRNTKFVRCVRTASEIMAYGLKHVRKSGGEFRTVSYEDIIVDVAVWNGVAEAMPIADFCLAKELITKQSLRMAIERRGRQRSGRARLVLKYVTGRSESPRESRLRAMMILAGFGDFYIQADIFNARGRFVGRVDFLFPQFGFAVEYDGEGKYFGEFGKSREEALAEDVERHHNLSNVGIRLLRINKEMVRSGEWLECIASAIARARPDDAVDSALFGGGVFVCSK